MTPRRIGSRESSHPRSRRRRGQIVRAQWLTSFIKPIRQKLPDLVLDLNWGELAARTLNYTRAEIQSVVQHAWKSALSRIHSNRPGDGNSIKVTMHDFMIALETVVPELGIRRPNGTVGCGDRHKHIYKTAMQLVKQVKGRTGSPLVTCLLEGPNGSGKTALAATVGIHSGFRCVKFVSAETMLLQDERDKCQKIKEVFF
ncbi:hypothetical protein BT93_E2234 [Corymbia citriodora subsp. variegata]|nr:hypothetical protein BT93_E2234 [Corymbia citriodora subsp. variegata]